MTKENTMPLRRIYNILFSVVIVIAGICLMAACLGIYQSGDQPFSRESVAAAFSGIAFPVYLCLAMTIISFVWEFFLPSGKEKTPMFKPYQAMLGRLQDKRDMSQCEEALRNEITALQKKRRTHAIIRTAVLTVSSIIFLVYACNSSNFHQSEINSSMINAMKVLIPCLLVSFAYALFASIQNEKSLAKEIELMKQVPAAAKKAGSVHAQQAGFMDTDGTSGAGTIEKTVSNSSGMKLRPYRNVLLAAAVSFIVYGFISGGTVDVLAKAINICTECIGLG